MKRLYLKFISIFLISGNILVAQPFTLQVKITNQPENPINIGTVRGDKFISVDTLEVHPVMDNSSADNNSEESIHRVTARQPVKIVNFKFPNNAVPGVYRLIFGKTTYAKVMGESPQQLDFIFNNEDIVFETDFKAPQDSLKVIRSKENSLWFGFLREEKKLRAQLDELEIEVNYYQDKTKTSPDLKSGADLVEVKSKAIEKANEFNQLQIQRDMLITQTANENEGTFAAKLIRTFREPFRDGYLTPEERKRSFQQEYFKFLDLSDESLINSPVLTDKVFNFLVTYNQPGFIREQREQAYMKAVDIILSEVKNSEGLTSGETHTRNGVYELILNYLVSGFEILRMENLLDYISDNYAAPVCQSDEKTTLERRMESRKMKSGTVVPDFTLNDINGDPVTLSQILKGRNLILFWASWCPHCCEMLPMIRTWYDQAHGIDFEIIAISLDTSLTEWYKAVIKAGFEVFYNLSDLQKWDSTVTEEYNVYATPTMFIVDQNRKILAKPVSFQELIETIRK